MEKFSEQVPSFGSKKEVLKFGFETTKANIKFFILVLLVSASIQIISSWISNAVPEEQSLISFLVGIIIWVVASVVAVGQLKIALKFIDKQKAEVTDLFSYYKLALKYMAGSILFGLIVAVGFILLIIPGIIWSIKFQFYSYLIADKGMGPIEALKMSWQMTKGVKWNLFLFGLLTTLINIAGALALVIGLIITIPTTTIATASVYRKLLNQQ